MFLELLRINNAVGVDGILTAPGDILLESMNHYWATVNISDANPLDSNNNSKPINPNALNGSKYTKKTLKGNLLSTAASAKPVTISPIANPKRFHLMFAYMLENTRVLDVMERIIQIAHYSEDPELLSEASLKWAINTEQLFYRALPGFVPFDLRSDLRMDIAMSRRNAYYRMFGMKLNHPPSKEGMNFPMPKASNKDFVRVFEEFLREVWRGIINANNTAGANVTDRGAISNLAEKIQNMLTVRRRNMYLAREEFFYTTMLSWFFMTLSQDSVLIKDFGAEASSPEERLRKLGEKVKVPIHEKSRNFFELAEPISKILMLIEAGTFSTPGGAQTLYSQGSALALDMNRIITHWSMATGRNIKQGALSHERQNGRLVSV